MHFLLTYCLVIGSVVTIDGFADDEITSLPGLASKPPFRQYSGYLNGGEDIWLHYWFVESQGKPETDPVLLWLQGGPGGSSLFGFFTENGPFRVTKDGRNLTADPNSWNTLANVLYLESPVGVGFSYSNDTKFINNNDKTARMNHLALEDFFFNKFPQFSKNPFYITGESYAGIYTPTLAVEIFRKKSRINLKGIACGNALLNSGPFDGSVLDMALYHGLVDQQYYSDIRSQYCKCQGNGLACNFTAAGDIWNGYLATKIELVNPYNLLSDCPPQVPFTGNQSVLEQRFGSEYVLALEDRAPTPECPPDTTRLYLDNHEVRQALHIPHFVSRNWTEATDIPYEREYPSMSSQMKELIDVHKLSSIIVYNGDLDMVCDFICDQRFVDNLGYTVKEPYKAWKLNGRIGGFVKRYEGITFTTVRDAGHMAPADQPEATLEVIKELIGKSKLK